MDEELSRDYNVRDIVDTVTYDGRPFNTELLLKALLGGINNTYDTMGEHK